jgi:hypothetical protein
MKEDRAIVIKTDLQLGSVQDNFEEVKALVRSEMEQYEGLVFADDDIRDAKTTRAKLNKMRKQIDDRRKAIKKQWNEPYVDFENKVKEVLEFIDNPLKQIDLQVKNFEERQKELKRADIKEILEEQIGKQPEHIQDVISRCAWAYDERWENLTVSLTAVARQSDEMIGNIVKAVNAIDDGSKYVPQLLGMYEERGNITDVLAYRKQLEERDRQYEIQKEKERQEIEKRKKAEADMLREEQDRKNAQPNPQPEREPEDPGDLGEQREPVAPLTEPSAGYSAMSQSEEPKEHRMFTKTFTVTASYDMFKVLIEFMRNSEIKFELVKEK